MTPTPTPTVIGPGTARFVSPGIFRHLGFAGEPEFLFTETVRRRRTSAAAAARDGDEIVRDLFRRAAGRPGDLDPVMAVVPPSEARRLLRRPRVSDKYVYYAFRRSFVEETETEEKGAAARAGNPGDRSS